jgi:hypothetical protein
MLSPRSVDWDITSMDSLGFNLTNVSHPFGFFFPIVVWCQARVFPKHGRALIHSVESQLPADAFTRDVKDAWLEVYGALSYDMIRAQKEAK